jgi:hypothetical protein
MGDNSESNETLYGVKLNEQYIYPDQFSTTYEYNDFCKIRRENNLELFAFDETRPTYVLFGLPELSNIQVSFLSCCDKISINKTYNETHDTILSEEMEYLHVNNKYIEDIYESSPYHELYWRICLYGNDNALDSSLELKDCDKLFDTGVIGEFGEYQLFLWNTRHKYVIFHRTTVNNEWKMTTFKTKKETLSQFRELRKTGYFMNLPESKDKIEFATMYQLRNNIFYCIGVI